MLGLAMSEHTIHLRLGTGYSANLGDRRHWPGGLELGRIKGADGARCRSEAGQHVQLPHAAGPRSEGTSWPRECWIKPKGLLRSEHFQVEGTLVSARASRKSYVPKDAGRPSSSGSQGSRVVDFGSRTASRARVRGMRQVHSALSNPQLAGIALLNTIGAV